MQCNFNQIAIVLWNMCCFWILKLLSLDQQLSFRSLYHLLFVFSGFSWVFRRRNHSNNKDASTLYPSNSTAMLHGALNEKKCTIRNSSQKLNIFVVFYLVCDSDFSQIFLILEHFTFALFIVMHMTRRWFRPSVHTWIGLVFKLLQVHTYLISFFENIS